MTDGQKTLKELRGKNLQMLSRSRKEENFGGEDSVGQWHVESEKVLAELFIYYRCESKEIFLSQSNVRHIESID